MNKWLLAGSVPYLGVVLVATTSGYFAYYSAATSIQCPPPMAKIAIAEKDAVIMNTVLSNPSLSEEMLDSGLKQPILNVIRRYTDDGYVVLNVNSDKDGNFTLIGLPNDAKDITSEMKEAVRAGVKP